MEGAGQMKRRKLDDPKAKMRHCYRQASLYLMIILIGFALIRTIS
jgi:hypothetical protein